MCSSAPCASSRSCVEYETTFLPTSNNKPAKEEEEEEEDDDDDDDEDEEDDEDESFPITFFADRERSATHSTPGDPSIVGVTQCTKSSFCPLLSFPWPFPLLLLVSSAAGELKSQDDADWRAEPSSCSPWGTTSMRLLNSMMVSSPAASPFLVLERRCGRSFDFGNV